MSHILHIETATDVCSVCVAENGILLGIGERKEKNNHATLLHVLIDGLLKKLGLPYSSLDAIAVSMGPGSYTGLRIGVSAAKGFCFSLDKPLIAVNTLKSMTDFYLQNLINQEYIDTDLFCPMIDARRMEVYNAVLDNRLNFVEQTNARILDANSYHEILSHNKVHFFGDGSFKLQKMISNHPNALFTENFSTSSRGMIGPSHEAFLTHNFSDLAHFEPFYLKDFVSSKLNMIKIS